MFVQQFLNWVELHGQNCWLSEQILNRRNQVAEFNRRKILKKSCNRFKGYLNWQTKNWKSFRDEVMDSLS